MLTPDQITAIAPDAASLKAGRDLGTARKWDSIGGDSEVLWGLARGSGKEPYQTRVALADLATKCSCPSRKFPCKHALGLMFLAASDPADGSFSLPASGRPPWVAEWVDSRAARDQKAAANAAGAGEKPAKPADAKAALKRRDQRETRMREGAEMLDQVLLDLIRGGLADTTARNPGMWEDLARRMIDSQLPGLAGLIRQIPEAILGSPEVDTLLPLEVGRLHLLLETYLRGSSEESTRAEISALLGDREEFDLEMESVEDQWLVLGKSHWERDRLITSATWLLGERTKRWARVLRFFPMGQLADPWPTGASVKTSLTFRPGLLPVRADPTDAGILETSPIPAPQVLPDGQEITLEEMLGRYRSALAVNPFLKTLPFLLPLMPSPATPGSQPDRILVDAEGKSLPWKASTRTAFRVECICAGRLVPVCGEWDGRHLTLLSILDGETWTSLGSRPS